MITYACMSYFGISLFLRDAIAVATRGHNDVDRHSSSVAVSG